MPDPTTHFETHALRVAIHTSPDVVVVSAYGEIDLATVSLLRAALEAAVTTDSAHVVLDAAAVTFLDAAGLRGVLAPVSGVAPDTVRIRNPSAPVLRVLTLVGCSHLVETPSPTAGLPPPPPSPVHRQRAQPGHLPVGWASGCDA